MKKLLFVTALVAVAANNLNGSEREIGSAALRGFLVSAPSALAQSLETDQEVIAAFREVDLANKAQQEHHRLCEVPEEPGIIVGLSQIVTQLTHLINVTDKGVKFLNVLDAKVGLCQPLPETKSSFGLFYSKITDLKSQGSAELNDRIKSLADFKKEHASVVLPESLRVIAPQLFSAQPAPQEVALVVENAGLVQPNLALAMAVLELRKCLTLEEVAEKMEALTNAVEARADAGEFEDPIVQCKEGIRIVDLIETDVQALQAAGEGQALKKQRFLAVLKESRQSFRD